MSDYMGRGMTSTRAKEVIDYIRKTKPKKGPMAIHLSPQEILELCMAYVSYEQRLLEDVRAAKSR